VKPPRSAEPLGYLLLTLLTCASLAFQHYRGDEPEDEIVYASRLKVGTVFPTLHLRALTGAPAAADEASTRRCRIYVVFHPRCVHCSIAAGRERSAPGGGSRLPVTWISGFDDRDALAFGRQLAPSSRLLYDPDAPRNLKVNGVPTAFVVSADGRLRYFWVYQGNEDHRRLARRC
jgi:hypothetical protein